MKKQLLSAVMLCTLGVVGCGEDNPNPTPPVDTGPKYNTEDKVFNHLEGKTMVMEGENIPDTPNGISEDVVFGDATQCYNKVTMQMGARNLTVTSVRAVIEGATGNPPVGNCNRANIRDTLAPFTSTIVAISNVKEDGSCFDITVTFGGRGFSQEGRGLVSQDGKMLQLELYFPGALGHRCADGAVGAKTVRQNNRDITGNTVQKYVIQ
ncbi:MAG TPA: hypothetical protein VEY88_25045 [Archangium sp.]|nr:hypothetical protein [Archangium sp.]